MYDNKAINRALISQDEKKKMYHHVKRKALKMPFNEASEYTEKMYEAGCITPHQLGLIDSMLISKDATDGQIK